MSEAIPRTGIRRLTSDDAAGLEAFARAELHVRHEFLWACTYLDQTEVWAVWSRDGRRVTAAVAIGGWGATFAGPSDEVDALVEHTIDRTDRLLMWMGSHADLAGLSAAERSRSVHEQSLMTFDGAGHGARPSADQPRRVGLATAEHVPLLASTRLRTYADEFGIEIAPFSPLDSELIGHLVNASGAGSIVMELEGDRIAFTGEQCAGTADVVAIYSIFVDPVLRRRGLAQRHLREWCADLLTTTRHVVLRVGVENAAAIALYEQLGFRATSPYLCLVRPPA